jgi:hypothetical protein
MNQTIKMARPVPSWKKVISPEVSAISKCLNTISVDNFEGNRDAILKFNILTEPDDMKPNPEDNDKMLPIVREFINSIAYAKVDDTIGLKLYANLFAELARNWRGRHRSVLIELSLVKIEEELQNYIISNYEDEDIIEKMNRKTSNLITFLFYVYLYKNYKIIPVQVPLRALYMFMSDNPKLNKTIIPFLLSEDFTLITKNEIYTKYIHDNLINKMKKWESEMTGKNKYDLRTILNKNF